MLEHLNIFILYANPSFSMQFVMRKLQNINSLRNCVNSQAIALVHTNILIKALNQRIPSKNKVWDWVYILFHCCSVLLILLTVNIIMTCSGRVEWTPVLCCLVGSCNVTAPKKFYVHENTVYCDDPPATPAKNEEIPGEKISVQSSHSGLISLSGPSVYE